MMADPDENPIRVLLYSDQFASCDDADAVGFSASGHNALATLAGRLLAAAFDPDRPLILFRGGERVGRTTVAIAAQLNSGTD